jgi:hypothetical protein
MSWNALIALNVFLAAATLLFSPMQNVSALTAEEISECERLADHINAKVINTSGEGQVRLSSGVEVGCEILSFLVYEGSVNLVRAIA